MRSAKGGNVKPQTRALSLREELRTAIAGEPADAAAYIAELAADLAVIARRNGLDTVGYLLDMARLEAESQSPGPSKRR